MRRSLQQNVRSVVRNGNCSGCGACALLAPGITMDLDAEGFLRPVFSGREYSDHSTGSTNEIVKQFQRICPGSRVTRAVEPGASDHPIFGTFISAWEGWAVDPHVREQGSSGGVLTALASWMLESGVVSEVTGVRSSSTVPQRSVPVRITSRAEALSSAGSRYAPVAGATLPVRDSKSVQGVIAKPCEAAARRALIQTDVGGAHATESIILSFFCAGTPSQRATDSLVSELGLRLEELESLRYRGEGWPGYFTAVDRGGKVGRVSYDVSWGQRLGRDIQSRCKICADGTGELADIAVGDFWFADDAGYPVFENAEGNSVVIARTARGHEILELASKAGVIQIAPISLDEVTRVQPLQARRVREILARLGGRVLSGRRIPRYVGFSLWKRRERRLSVFLRAAAGTWIRAVRSRRAK